MSILEKVKEASLKVKKGEVVFERDSVTFERIVYSWPVTAALMRIHAIEGRLNLIDFGGALGSSYFQNRKFLKGLNTNWTVVEQKHFTDAGNALFSDGKLKFYYDIESVVKANPVDAILLSSVIQYIEKPHEFIKKVTGFDFKYIIIDRTPFITRGKDRLTIQKVPPSIYKAAYPCWFFDESRFLEKFNTHYTMIEEFEALDRANIPSKFKGFIFELKGK